MIRGITSGCGRGPPPAFFHQKPAQRGNALALLLDLARKPVFLHDGSVHSLDELLNPKRGKTSPHPLYVATSAQRGELVAHLKSLDTTSK